MVNAEGAGTGIGIGVIAVAGAIALGIGINRGGQATVDFTQTTAANAVSAYVSHLNEASLRENLEELNDRNPYRTVRFVSAEESGFTDDTGSGIPYCASIEITPTSVSLDEPKKAEVRTWQPSERNWWERDVEDRCRPGSRTWETEVQELFEYDAKSEKLEHSVRNGGFFSRKFGGSGTDEVNSPNTYLNLSGILEDVPSGDPLYRRFAEDITAKALTL